MASNQSLGAAKQAPVASVLHTIFVLVILLSGALLMRVNAARMRLNRNPDRPLFYLVTIAAEWLVLLVVLAGLRAHKTPLIEILGARWASAKEVFRDIGIGLLFWLTVILILAAPGFLLHTRANNWVFSPHSRGELVVWFLVSLSAGICEETIFRGYLQRQIIAWTGRVEVGVCVTAAVFGAGHMYQGMKAAIMIGFYGLLLGLLAQWRSSIRPGIIAHTLQDSVAGLAAFLFRR